MRAIRQWLLDVGNGMPITLNTGVTVVSTSVAIAPSMQVPDLHSLQRFVIDDYSDLSGKAILTLTNSTTTEVNNVCLVNLRTEERVYLANSTALPNDPVGEGQPYSVPPQELINTLSHRSLPPHELKLRFGCRVMLLRILAVKSGLCNGTMMKVLQFYNNSIIVKILNGVRTGQVEYLFRVKLTAQHRNYPVNLQRNQFPIHLTFSMTINKSQGQSFDRVGIYLDRGVFSHGQLYVALSRAKRKDDLCLCIGKQPTLRRSIALSEVIVQNVIYHELLHDQQLIVRDAPNPEVRPFQVL